MTGARSRGSVWHVSARRVPVRQLLVVALLMAVGVFGTRSRVSAQEVIPVPLLTLEGLGSWGPFGEMTAWQNALYGEAGKPFMDLGYRADGDQLAREQFVDGAGDFVISGTPFLDDELAKVPGGRDGLISAPIHATALAFLLYTPPNPGSGGGLASNVQVCDPDLPGNEEKNCFEVRQYNGPIRVPDETLAAMTWSTSGSCPPPAGSGVTGSQDLNSWNCAGVLEAMGLPDIVEFFGGRVTPFHRSDASATNFFLQQYVKKAAPNVWQGLVADASTTWEPIGERLPRAPGETRQGALAQVLTLGLQRGIFSGGSRYLKQRRHRAQPAVGEVEGLRCAAVK